MLIITEVEISSKLSVGDVVAARGYRENIKVINIQKIEFMSNGLIKYRITGFLTTVNPTV